MYAIYLQERIVLLRRFELPLQKKENRFADYPLLHQNGRIYWIQRDVKALPTHGRPLSQKTSPEELYRQRKPLYEAFSDRIIDNNTDAESAARQILSLEDVK